VLGADGGRSLRTLRFGPGALWRAGSPSPSGNNQEIGPAVFSQAPFRTHPKAVSGTKFAARGQSHQPGCERRSAFAGLLENFKRPNGIQFVEPRIEKNLNAHD